MINGDVQIAISRRDQATAAAAGGSDQRDKRRKSVERLEFQIRSHSSFIGM